MSYELNGERVHLDKAVVQIFSQGVRSYVVGSSAVQGDVNVISILVGDNPLITGTFSTNERTSNFSVGAPSGSCSTLDIENQDCGVGTLTITEISTTYVKGSFDFIADALCSGSLDQSFDVADGEFTAQIMNF